MPGERTPGSVGAKLCEARERRGMSLREIANSTKISVQQLEALERNDISQLPGGIFSRGFMRSFAIEVGLDPEQVVQDFMVQFPDESVTAGHPTTVRLDRQQTNDLEGRQVSVFGLLAALSIPIAAVLLYVAGSDRTSSQSEQVAAAASPVGAPTDPAHTLSASNARPSPAPRSEAQVEGSASPPQTVGSPATSVGLVVDLMATERCWISADVDGARVIQREFQPGERQRLNVRDELVLTAANAAALIVTLNGTETRPLGPPGKAATVRIGPANFREYLVRP